MAFNMLPSIARKAVSIAAREWDGFGAASSAKAPLSEARLHRWLSMSCLLRDTFSATIEITAFLHASSLSLARNVRHGG